MKKLLLIISLLISAAGCQQEIAKWEFARAELLAEIGDVTTAVGQMKDALKKIGDDPSLKLRLAEQLAKQGDAEAVKLCDEILAGDGPARFRQTVLLRKSICQQQVGQFGEALETYKQVLAGHVSRSSEELNGLAYYRALAGRELMLAASEIDAAIAAEEKSRWPSGLHLPLALRTEIAVAVTSRRLGQQSAAIETLTRQIDGLELELARIQGVALPPIKDDPLHDTELDNRLQQEANLVRNLDEVVRHWLALMTTLRALLNQDLGDDQACNADRLQVREWGFDATELARQLPAAIECQDTLQIGMMLLDTRGFVLGQLPWNSAGLISEKWANGSHFRISSYTEAMQDLNLAVRAIETLRAALEKSMFQPIDNTVSASKHFQSEMQRTEAVLRYHRMVVNERKGDAEAIEAVKADRQRIQQLGFEPNERLF